LCHNAKVVHAFEAITPSEKLLPGAQITHRGKIPIAPAAPPVPRFPRFRALALFGRRPKERVDSLVMPASENLHTSGLMRRNNAAFHSITASVLARAKMPREANL